MIAQEILDVDLSSWVPGTRLFAAGDGHLLIIADLSEYPDSRMKFIRQPTAVLTCTADATVTDMTPTHNFDPGTTAEDALAALGYTL